MKTGAKNFVKTAFQVSRECGNVAEVVNVFRFTFFFPCCDENKNVIKYHFVVKAFCNICCWTSIIVFRFSSTNLTCYDFSINFWFHFHNSQIFQAEDLGSASSSPKFYSYICVLLLFSALSFYYSIM